MEEKEFDRVERAISFNTLMLNLNALGDMLQQDAAILNDWIDTDELPAEEKAQYIDANVQVWNHFANVINLIKATSEGLPEFINDRIVNQDPGEIHVHISSEAYMTKERMDAIDRVGRIVAEEQRQMAEVAAEQSMGWLGDDWDDEDEDDDDYDYDGEDEDPYDVDDINLPKDYDELEVEEDRMELDPDE